MERGRDKAPDAGVVDPPREVPQHADVSGRCEEGALHPQQHLGLCRGRGPRIVDQGRHRVVTRLGVGLGNHGCQEFAEGFWVVELGHEERRSAAVDHRCRYRDHGLRADRCSERLEAIEELLDLVVDAVRHHLFAPPLAQHLALSQTLVECSAGGAEIVGEIRHRGVDHCVGRRQIE